MKSKLTTMAFCIAALLGTAITVEAKVGGSTSTAVSSRSTSTSSSSGRVGGGSSMGMTRSDTLSKARPDSYGSRPPNSNYGVAYSQPARSPTPGYAPSAAPPQTAIPPRQYGVGTVAAAAAAGGVAGYLMGNSNHSGQEYSVGQGQVPAAPTYGQPSGVGATGGYAAPQQTYQGAPIQQSGGSSLGLWFALAGLTIGGYFVYKAYSKKGGNSVSNEFQENRSVFRVPNLPTLTEAQASRERLLMTAPDMFRKLQKANNEKDVETLQALTTPAMYDLLADDIKNRTEESATRVVSLGIEGERVLDFKNQGEQCVASIHFTGTVSEGHGAVVVESLNELWHFTLAKGSNNWRVAGIEQV